MNSVNQKDDSDKDEEAANEPQNESQNEPKKKTLSLSSSGTLELNQRKKLADIDQSFSHGRTNKVKVEVRRKRVITRDEEEEKPEEGLNSQERAARQKALEQARLDAEEAERLKEEEAKQKAEEAKRKAEEPAADNEEEVVETPSAETSKKTKPEKPAEKEASIPASPEDTASQEEWQRKNQKKTRPVEQESEKKPAPSTRRGEPRRRQGKLTLSQALMGEDESQRMPSMAAMRRRQEKQKKSAHDPASAKKQVREIVVPETITVQELSNRMAVRGADVVKELMKLGIMATINQIIDADTAELVIQEFGHNVKRVSESDVEIGIMGDDDKEKDLVPRAPVVTVMGHVDHGKTSLLDALKQTDIAAGEAGGITQHIGAYKVHLKSGDEITFIDTPGHAAFTEMRSRGANVTDIVVLVVAADDGIMAQTVEAINHAKAAEVPMIIAINKMDVPGADPNRVRTELLNHEIVVEEMGGDVLSIEVSALQKTNLDKLGEAILLQAELQELKANPKRSAQGIVIEAKLEQGRGSVATVLIQRGTLKLGDIFVTGAEWGRVRAMIDDKGKHVTKALPSDPVEVIGLNATPVAGDDFVVVENEAKAREISEFRQRQIKNKSAATGRGTIEQMMALATKEGERKELPVIIKTDVHGSLEAIRTSLEKFNSDEVEVNILSSGVGGITESDVTLAKASNALIVGFNVRANPQARESARVDNVNINYYSIIYDVLEDVKALMGGMLAPTIQEDFIGYAEIREVFNITKVGKVAGCYIKEGVVKRGAGVRLLRDDVVIHEGMLKTLKRFKDEVKEVKESYECGMAFENYDDIKPGDVVECFEKKEVARTLEEKSS